MQLSSLDKNAIEIVGLICANGLALQLAGTLDKGVGRGEGEKHTYKTLLCAGMHFQDRYNCDVERVKRCVILYSTPSGLFPFCTFNCGPMYRPLVEAAYAEHCQALRAARDRAANVMIPQPADSR